jgi:hypothetical protein
MKRLFVILILLSINIANRSEVRISIKSPKKMQKLPVQIRIQMAIVIAQSRGQLQA